MIMQFGLEDLSTKLDGATPTTLTIMLSMMTMTGLNGFQPNRDVESDNNVVIITDGENGSLVYYLNKGGNEEVTMIEI